MPAVVTEVEADNENERVFAVIPDQKMVCGQPFIANMRHEILNAVGINHGDPITADRPDVVAATFSVMPEQWTPENKNARIFHLTVKYRPR